MLHTLISPNAYSAGRLYALKHDLLPCDQWLRENGFSDALDHHHFVCGFRDEKAADALAGVVIPSFTECCCKLRCEVDFPGLQGLS